jgi:hypothetical protein
VGGGEHGGGSWGAYEYGMSIHAYGTHTWAWACAWGSSETLIDMHGCNGPGWYKAKLVLSTRGIDVLSPSKEMLLICYTTILHVGLTQSL